MIKIPLTRCGARINNRYVYRMDFEYQVYGKNYTCTARTVRPQILDDELEEPLVYSTRNPGQAVMFDLLPRSIQQKLESKFPILKSRHEEPPYYS